MPAFSWRHLLSVLCCCSGIAHGAPRVQWSYALPGPSWDPAAVVLEIPASEQDDRFAVVLMRGGLAWHEAFATQGQSDRVSARTNSGLGHTSVFLTSDAPYLVVNHHGLDGSGPRTCHIQRHAQDLTRLWQRTFDDRAACRTVQALQVGALVADISRVVRLNDDGDTLWELSTEQVGGLVNSVVETSSGRLLLFIQTLSVVQVRDGSTGALLATHAGPPQIRAVRRTDTALETLGYSQIEPEVQRWSHEGAPLPGYVLPAFTGGLRNAVAHPDGFVLIGVDADEHLQIRYYDGLVQRWSHDHGPVEPGTFGFLHERDGRVVYAVGSTKYRLDIDGTAMPPIDGYARTIRYDSEGGLWLRRYGYLTDQGGWDWKIDRYLPGQAHPQFTHTLRLPFGSPAVHALHADARGVHAASSLYAASDAPTTVPQLQLHDLNFAGHARSANQFDWPLYPIEDVGKVKSGWVVLSRPEWDTEVQSSPDLVLSGLNSTGKVLWQRILTGLYSGQLRCDGAQHCGLITGGQSPTLEILNSAGQTQQRESLPQGSQWSLLAEAGHLLLMGHGEQVSLHDLDDPTWPLVARMPRVLDGQQGVQLNPMRLLQVRPSVGLQAWGVDQLVWQRSDLAETKILGVQPLLHVLQNPADGPPRLLQLNPDTGATVASVALPDDAISVQPDRGPDRPGTFTTYTYASSVEGGTALLTSTATGIPRLLHWAGGSTLSELPLTGGLLTLRAAGDAFYGAANHIETDGTRTLAVHQWVTSLLNDGFETP